MLRTSEGFILKYVNVKITFTISRLIGCESQVESSAFCWNQRYKSSPGFVAD